MKKHILLLLLLCLSMGQLLAQKPPTDLKQQADEAFENKRYTTAIDLYREHLKVKPQDNTSRMRLGEALLLTEKASEALPYFEAEVKNKKPDSRAYLLLAQAEQLLLEFEDAAHHYKEFLQSSDPKGEEREQIKDFITQCLAAQKVSNSEAGVVVENLGDKVNTAAQELRPVLSQKGGGEMYFSSDFVGNKLQVFKTIKEAGEWTYLQPLSKTSYSNTFLLDFFSQGTQMLFQRGVDSVSAKTFTKATNPLEQKGADNAVQGVLNLGLGTGTAQLFNDTIAVFSALRPEGQGGKDLYIAFKNVKSGEWGNARNLGNLINTKYDEESPYLAKDGRTLYFSSNKPNGLGGYDIYRCQFSDSTQLWSVPQNLGSPINSTRDDLHYRLSSDGLKAYFSSNRVGGFGGSDIYVIYYRRYRAENLSSLKPIVFQYVLDKPSVNGGQLLAKKPSFPLELLDAPNNDSTNRKNFVVYNLGPIYYDGETGILTPPSVRIVNELARMLVENPGVVAMLTAHSDNFGPANNALFLSARQAENVANQLIAKGVSPNNIIARGGGMAYPASRYTNDKGEVVSVSALVNRRIDITCFNIGDKPIALQIEKVEVPAEIAASEHKKFLSDQKDLYFKVQIKAIKTLLDDPVLFQTKEALTEVVLGGSPSILRYLVGHHRSYADAAKLSEQLKAKGFTDAFVVAYFNGIRITNEQAVAIAEKYPAIKDYLKAKGIDPNTKPKPAPEKVNSPAPAPEQAPSASPQTPAPNNKGKTKAKAPAKKTSPAASKASPKKEPVKKETSKKQPKTTSKKKTK